MIPEDIDRRLRELEARTGNGLFVRQDVWREFRVALDKRFIDLGEDVIECKEAISNHQAEHEKDRRLLRTVLYTAVGSLIVSGLLGFIGFLVSVASRTGGP